MLINICFGFIMFIVSLIEFSKHVQNEISAKVMPKPQNFTADFADRTDRRNYDPPKTPNYAERTTSPRSEVSVVRIFRFPAHSGRCHMYGYSQLPARPRTLRDICNGRANTAVARGGPRLNPACEILGKSSQLGSAKP